MLIVMAGLPGTGKSTVAEASAAALGLPVVSVDPIESAILSAVIFNALIIIALIPLALRGVSYQAMGAEAVLFSVDYPFVLNPPGVKWMQEAPLSPADRAKILSGNARSLLKI